MARCVAVAVITFAHRGARLEAPENTLPAFRQALAAGVAGLETDVWLSGDGEVVCAHDPVVARGLRRRKVMGSTAAELATFGVPRLAELYDELGAGYELSVDVKSPEVAAPLERHAYELSAAGIDAMNLHHTEWTAGLVSLFHRFDVRAFAWDAQEVRQIRAVLRMDIDAVYCDRPDRMVATVSEWVTDDDRP